MFAVNIIHRSPLYQMLTVSAFLFPCPSILPSGFAILPSLPEVPSNFGCRPIHQTLQLVRSMVLGKWKATVPSPPRHILTKPNTSPWNIRWKSKGPWVPFSIYAHHLKHPRARVCICVCVCVCVCVWERENRKQVRLKYFTRKQNRRKSVEDSGMEKRPKRSRRLPLVHDTLPTLQWWGRTECKSLGRGRCGAEKNQPPKVSTEWV